MKDHNRQKQFSALHILVCALAILCSPFDEARAQWTTNGNNINNTNSGSVGIGTSDPSVGGTENWNRLTVQGTDTTAVVTGIINAGSGHAGLILRRTGTTPSRWYQYIPVGSNDLRFYNGGDRFTLQSSGNMGIGTMTPSDKLHVVGGLRLDNSSGPTYGMRMTEASTGGYPSLSIGPSYQTGLTFTTMFTGGGYASAPKDNSLYLYSSFNPSDSNHYRFAVVNMRGIGELNISNIKSGSITGESADAGAITFSPSGVEKVRISNTGNVGIGISSPTSKLHVVGDLTVTGNIAAKYQDVAEWVPSSYALSAGTVVIVDPTKSNQVAASSQAYDTRVAGVISAQPGLTLGEGGAGKVLVATTGRLRIKVDATSAPVRVGDLLVTSDKEGIAMKSQPVNVGGVQIHRPGTLLGKALEPLEKGTGEILVLLSLQ